MISHSQFTREDSSFLIQKNLGQIIYLCQNKNLQEAGKMEDHFLSWEFGTQQDPETHVGLGDTQRSPGRQVYGTGKMLGMAGEKNRTKL